MINIALYSPQIPQNTGNIARTVAVTNTRLHLIKPLGFSLEDKYLKRSGLDYWDLLDLEVHQNLQEFLAKYEDENMYFISKKSSNTYSDIIYKKGDFLIFGMETKGLPDDLLQKNKENSVRIPMLDVEKARSLNLSNAVNIVLYEALRQNSFFNLK